MSIFADNTIDYDALLQDSLRYMMATILGEVGKSGLPGEHHFYIGFSTRANGVHISDRLLKDYPEEMVIVLRNQFQNLKVADTAFEVTLFFGGIPETLKVPFKAIKRFEDPSSDFSLSFSVEVEPTKLGLVEDLSDLETGLLDEETSEPEVSLLRKHAKSGDAVDPKKGDSDDQEEDQTTSVESGAKVVSLDQFRKA